MDAFATDLLDSGGGGGKKALAVHSAISYVVHVVTAVRIMSYFYIHVPCFNTCRHSEHIISFCTVSKRKFFSGQVIVVYGDYALVLLLIFLTYIDM
jgi:hypothetical protein